MDPEFKDFLDELGIASPEKVLVDEEPPEAVNPDKLRAFHRRELSGPEAEWVAFLISRYRAWYDADLQIVLQTELQPDAKAVPGTVQGAVARAGSLLQQVKEYLASEYIALLGQLPLFTPAAVHADALAPYRPLLRHIVCEEWNWAAQRGNPDYQDQSRLAEAVAEALARHSSEFPFPPALLAAILVKEGLNDICNLEDRDE
jgi:hypothetical protein